MLGFCVHQFWHWGTWFPWLQNGIPRHWIWRGSLPVKMRIYLFDLNQIFRMSLPPNHWSSSVTVLPTFHDWRSELYVISRSPSYPRSSEWSIALWSRLLLQMELRWIRKWDEKGWYYFSIDKQVLLCDFGRTFILWNAFETSVNGILNDIGLCCSSISPGCFFSRRMLEPMVEFANPDVISGWDRAWVNSFNIARLMMMKSS